MLALMTALNYDHHQQLHFLKNPYSMQQSINLYLPRYLASKNILGYLKRRSTCQDDVVTTGTLHVLLKHRLWHKCC